jgi:predicted acylesterase/phospholipase RssA
MDRQKTAIVMAGGGMRSAHGAGFLYALGTEVRADLPDMVVGSSGNAGNVLYFAAGQYDSIRRIWLELLSTRKFISLWRFWRMMDVDYVVDQVLKRQEPLDVETLAKGRVQYFIPITDARTGIARYISKQDHIDPFEALRITKALPVFFGKRFNIFGSMYMDGELGQTIGGHVQCAIRNGAKRILVINDAHWTHTGRIAMELYAKLMPHGLAQAIRRDIFLNAVCVAAPGIEIVCVSPSILPANVSTRDEGKLRETFHRGVIDALAMEEELRRLFGGTPPPAIASAVSLMASAE